MLERNKRIWWFDCNLFCATVNLSSCLALLKPSLYYIQSLSNMPSTPTGLSHKVLKLARGEDRGGRKGLSERRGEITGKVENGEIEQLDRRL